MFEAFALGSVLPIEPMRFLLSRVQRLLKNKALAGQRAVDVRRFRQPTLIFAALLVKLGRLDKLSGAKGIHPGFEVCLTRSGGFAFGGGVLGKARDVGDGRLMLAPSLIAGLFHLAQLRGKATAFRLSLSPLALEVRLTFGERAGRRRQRGGVP